MEECWLEIEVAGARRKATLRPGRTRVGARGCDIVIAGHTGGELHVWDRPPKVIYPGGEPVPTAEGRPFDELELRDGSLLRWGATTITFRRSPAEGAAALIQEIPLDAVPPGKAAAKSAERHAATSSAGRPWRRVQSGILAELGLVDKKLAKRWQEAVKRGEFDPDAASEEILSETDADAHATRVLDRSSTLMRDLMMTPLLRGAQGAGRKARTAAKSGVAFFVTQALALLVYSLLVAVAVILIRVQWEVSFDGLIDRLLGR